MTHFSFDTEGSSRAPELGAPAVEVANFRHNGNDLFQQANATASGPQRTFSASSAGGNRWRMALVLMSGDAFSLAGSLGAVLWIATRVDSALFPLGNVNALCISAAVLGTIIGLITGLYPATGRDPVWELHRQLGVILAVHLLLLLGLAFVGIEGERVPFWLVTFSWSLLLSSVVVPFTRTSLRSLSCPSAWWGEPVLFVGASHETGSLWRLIAQSPERGWKPWGVTDEPRRLWSLESPVQILGDAEEASALIQRVQPRWAVLDVRDRSPQERTRLTSLTTGIPNVIRAAEDLDPGEFIGGCIEVGGRTMLRLSNCQGLAGNSRIKRMMDLILTLMASVVAIPLLFLLGCAIKYRSPGPVFYAQRRVGQFGQPFIAWKLRTMRLDADQVLAQCLGSDPQLRSDWETHHKLRQDPRVISGLGHWLRTFSLDELPQLWNVWRGEMSLVGPRPIVEDEIPRYGTAFTLYTQTRPGITGLWQVSGRNNTSYAQRVQLDACYVSCWSMWLDYSILLRTPWAVLRRDGAYLGNDKRTLSTLFPLGVGRDAG